MNALVAVVTRLVGAVPLQEEGAQRKQIDVHHVIQLAALVRTAPLHSTSAPNATRRKAGHKRTRFRSCLLGQFGLLQLPYLQKSRQMAPSLGALRFLSMYFSIVFPFKTYFSPFMTTMSELGFSSIDFFSSACFFCVS